MSAVALLARAHAAGVQVSVVGGDIRLRGRPEAALVQSMREAKPALVRLLTGRDCYRCGAAPEPLEIGGYDLTGWICNACLERAGLLELVPLEPEVERLIMAAERAIGSADALADPGELMLRGQLR